MRLIIALATMLVFLAGSGASAQRGHAYGPQKQGPPPKVASPHPAPQKAAQPNPHPAAKPGTGPTKTATTAKVTIITTTTPVATPVRNPRLEARLQALLPIGLNVYDAAMGFRNWGQFVAAVHVSRNLGIPFASLKARMIGSPAMSLGQAIQALRPAATTTLGTVTVEVSKAESQAAEDFREERDERR